MRRPDQKGNRVMQRRRHRDRESFGFIRFYPWKELYAMDKEDPRLRAGPGWYKFKNQHGAGFSRDVPAGITYVMKDVARQAMILARREDKKARTRLYRRDRQRRAYHLKVHGIVMEPFTGHILKRAGYEKKTKALAGVLGDTRKRKTDGASPVLQPGE